MEFVSFFLVGGRKKEGCGEWKYGECVPKRHSCGVGKKTGTREGAACRVKERQFKCSVPCGDATAEPEPEAEPTSRSKTRGNRRGRKGPNTGRIRSQHFLSKVN